MKRKIIDNRYEIIKKLGAGATGIVYKVRDTKDRKIITLKILSKRKTSSVTIQRFKREFKLLTELRHPNLCSVYDFGMLDDGRSYFTMEYIDGEDIFTASRGSSHKEIYPWIVQICRVLEYIHAKGLIHYDIKPGNVFIQMVDPNKSTVKLMDFGLAGEQQIRGGALIKGTFPYIAPEVIKGLAVDHRADLYSLGVLLYEIFTKKSLFGKEKKSYMSLLQQRIDWVSKPPSRIVSDIPRGLEQLILKFLAYEPAERFSHANEAIKEINKVSRSKFEVETETTLKSHILSSRFVGRDKEMALLKSSYEKARKGVSKVILITGDAGIGKSRLLKEFNVFAQLEHSYCFSGFTNKDKIRPLEPFYDIFKELISYIKEGYKIRTSLAVLFKIFPGLAKKHLRNNLPQLVPLEPEQEKVRTFEALSELMRYVASRLGEMVILLEDLHWADDLTIQFLEYLGRNLEESNIFI